MTERKGSLKITKVRYRGREAQNKLVNYIHRDLYTTFVPRGIEPGLVSDFIRENVKPDSPPSVYRNAVQLVRFYETTEVAGYMLTLLPKEIEDMDDITKIIKHYYFYRALFAVQAIAEVGSRQQADEAATYFNEKLVGYKDSLESINLLLETLIILAPSGTPDKLTRLIEEELSLREKEKDKDEEGMRAYNVISAVKRMYLPNTLRVIHAKTRLIKMAPKKRNAQLIDIYMGRSPISDDLIMTWAGRMLRKDARDAGTDLVLKAFAQEIDKIDPRKVGQDAQTDTYLCRAAHAIVYFGGNLSPAQEQLYKKAKRGAYNFLWDGNGDIPSYMLQNRRN